MSGPRYLMLFALGFLCNPVLWIALHHLITYKR